MQERVGFIVLGGIVGLIGAVMVANGFDTNTYTGGSEVTGLFYLGALLAAVGGILAQIGIIAVGVALGVNAEVPEAAPQS